MKNEKTVKQLHQDVVPTHRYNPETKKIEAVAPTAPQQPRSPFRLRLGTPNRQR